MLITRKNLMDNLELCIIKIKKVKKKYDNNKDDKLLQLIIFLLKIERK